MTAHGGGTVIFLFVAWGYLLLELYGTYLDHKHLERKETNDV